MTQKVSTPQEMLDNMAPEEAFDLIEQVCSKHLGTRNDHVFLSKALEVLKAATSPKE